MQSLMQAMVELILGDRGFWDVYIGKKQFARDFVFQKDKKKYLLLATSIGEMPIMF